MRKLFLALSVLAMLIFAAVPSQALVSMPDAAPGQNILLPFFLATVDAGEQTLLVIQEVHGVATTLALDVLDIDSTSRYDATLTLTGYDVAAYNVKDNWIANASVSDRTALKISLAGGTDNYYAGYCTLVNAATDANNLVGYIYQIDLANGIASATLAVSQEFENMAQVRTDLMVDANFIELFNADALAAAQMRIATVVPASSSTALSFAMFPRYYLYNATAKNYLLSWRSTDRLTVNHLDFYDTAELAYSANVTLTHELDILDAANIVPSAHLATYPAAGWIKFKVPDKQGSTLYPTDEWIMYNYQKVSGGTAGTNWNVIYGVHREAGTTSSTY